MADITKQIVSLASKIEGMQREVSQLSRVVESLARIEENLVNQKDDVDGFGRRMEAHEKRLRQMEVKLAINTSQGSITSRWVERIIMFVVIAALGAFNFFKE